MHESDKIKREMPVTKCTLSNALVKTTSVWCSQAVDGRRWMPEHFSEQRGKC